MFLEIDSIGNRRVSPLTRAAVLCIGFSAARAPKAPNQHGNALEKSTPQNVPRARFSANSPTSGFSRAPLCVPLFLFLSLGTARNSPLARRRFMPVYNLYIYVYHLCLSAAEKKRKRRSGLLLAFNDATYCWLFKVAAASLGLLEQVALFSSCMRKRQTAYI